MELFEKIYGCYYQVVRHILTEAGRESLTGKQMQEIAKRYGFQESALTILPKLQDGRWALLKEEPDGKWSPAVKRVPKLPLTKLQKRWLKSLTADPRFRLFFSDGEIAQIEEFLGDAEPLFYPEDFHYFDRYQDGDDYASPQYRGNFRTILAACKEERPLFVAYGERTYEVLPCKLQYSSKDDKFRLCCLAMSRGYFCRETVLNLGRMAACHLSKREITERDRTACRKHRWNGNDPSWFGSEHRAAEPVVIAIGGERNALERTMLHFASYEKHTEYDEEREAYVCSIYYDPADETELLIDILSFGPVIRVLGPEPFLRQVRKRVQRQHELLYGEIGR